MIGQQSHYPSLTEGPLFLREVGNDIMMNFVMSEENTDAFTTFFAVSRSTGFDVAHIP
jgi:hypothetical protein